MWLVREQLGEEAELLERDSRRARPRAGGGRRCCAAGWIPTTSPPPSGAPARGSSTPTTCIRRSAGARSAAAREAGARVVLHLHNYRLVCAVGTCFNSRGEDCTRCQGAQHAPGRAAQLPRQRAPRPSTYAAALAPWQRGWSRSADAVVVPSEAAARPPARRCGAPRRRRCTSSPHVVREFAERLDARPRASYALVASRLAPREGRRGRDRGVPQRRARRSSSPATGRARAARAAERALRRARRPRRARAPARAAPRWRSCPRARAETFGLAAAEAMAAGRAGRRLAASARWPSSSTRRARAAGRRRARWPSAITRRFGDAPPATARGSQRGRAARARPTAVRRAAPSCLLTAAAIT